MPVQVDSDQRELVIPPGEFAFVQDKTNGGIVTFVGPLVSTMGPNDVPMTFDPREKSFKRAELTNVKQKFVTAPAGWYVVLLNPEKSNNHPKVGVKSVMVDTIEVGKKIIFEGPCSFPLWPGQMYEVIKCHTLRTNEYLEIEVYDAGAAKTNWTKARVEINQPAEPNGGAAGEAGNAAATTATSAKKLLTSTVPEDLANGKRYVVKGTEIASYIPPTGVKVVKDEDGNFVRQAVTLEKLEYCILLGENGEKTYERGPKVVFPEPTQTFVTSRDGKSNKFRAFELDERKGVFVKVIEKYTDEESKKVYEEGEELFITGEGIIYFPRKEHAIVRYGDGQEVHYAMAIPKGEGRYFLNRKTGKIELVRGEKMYLADPRTHVYTRRVLSDKECELLYPGNEEALRVNRELAAQVKGMSAESVAAMASRVSEGLHRLALYGDQSLMAHASLRDGISAESSKQFGGDQFERRTEYTPPRTVILDTKYQGAVSVNIWTGFAVKVVDCSEGGQSRIEVGPKTLLLEYYETLEPMFLSTGKPKTTDKLLTTAFLQVTGNKVTDWISAVTQDMVNVTIKLAYRVNFEGQDQKKWFDVNNYVKLMCDHARSVLKGVVKKHTISSLHQSYTEIVRDALLGVKPEDKTERPGMKFDENATRVYDVEVLGFEIPDPNVKKMLEDAQGSAIRSTLSLAEKRRMVETEKEIQKLEKELLDAQRVTIVARHQAALQEIKERLDLATAEAKSQQDVTKAQAQFSRDQLEAAENHKRALEAATLKHRLAQRDEEVAREIDLAKKKVDASKERLTIEEELATAIRNRTQADQKIEVEYQKALLELVVATNKSRTDSATAVAQAFSPALVEALLSLRDEKMLEVLAAKFGDLSILHNEPILAVAQRFLGSALPDQFVKAIGRWTSARNVVEASDQVAGA